MESCLLNSLVAREVRYTPHLICVKNHCEKKCYFVILGL